MIPDYCTQNNGNCPSCSLSNYGRDCQNNRYAYTLGELAQAITGGNLPAMAKLLNDHGGMGAPIPEHIPQDETYLIHRWALVNLAGARAGDRVGRLAGALLVG